MIDISRQERLGLLRAALAKGSAEDITTCLRGAGADEMAECLMALETNELERLVLLLGDERLADVVEELETRDAARLLRRLNTADAADVLEEMAPDDATDVIEEFDLAEAQAIFVEMDAEEAEELRRLLGYPPDSAAGVMTPAFVAVRPELTADQALQAIRQLALIAETIYYVYVTDPDQKLLGVLSLRDLVVTRPDTLVRDLMLRDVSRVAATADQEEAALMLTERGLLALPVVDAAGRILGIITADDVAEIMERETTEDIEKLGGSQPLDVPYLRAGIVRIARKRVGWLLILFIAAGYTGTVMSAFEDTIATVVSLTFFIPLLIGTGGNAASQATMTVVRAMAVGEVRPRDIFRVVRTEVSVALLLSVVMAGAGFARALLLGVEPGVEIVIAATAAAIVVWAQFVAALLPFGIRRLGLDPAVVSAPLITTLVDGTGLVIYFTIAKLVLDL